MRRLIFGLLTVSVCFGTQCSQISHEPRPDHFGVFAVTGGGLVELRRLPGAEENKVANYFERGLGGAGRFHLIPNTLAGNAKLHFILYGDFAGPVIEPVVRSGGEYHALVYQKLGVKESPINGEKRMLRVQPAPPLRPGLYMLIAAGCRDNPADFQCYFPMQVQ